MARHIAQAAASRCCSRLLVIDAGGEPAMWLLLHTLPRNPDRLKPPRRAHGCTDTAALFPMLDLGEAVPGLAVRQALYQDMRLWRLTQS